MPTNFTGYSTHLGNSLIVGVAIKFTVWYSGIVFSRLVAGNLEN